ncbi:sigma-E factor negative regulatory protein [Aliikangiella sp. IMCC44359]|uniref:sigma-E factor negative regulatory protein n=1 Tax=Aliikangiella sp. IMCC44359 TaxID=3459125 RepID=UPI00403AE93A
MVNKSTFANHSGNDDQNLSDLLDGYGDVSESIEQLIDSEEQRQAWYRYNMVSSVLQKENSAFSSYEFSKAISAKIAEEPAIIARPKKQRKIASALWKKTGGLAVAASVAYAMVFSVDMMSPQQSGMGGDNTTAENQSNSAQDEDIVAISESDAAEQANLDRIQAILDRMKKNSLNVSEHLVGGEKIVSIKLNKVDELEKQVRDMKKPSEIKSKD